MDVIKKKHPILDESGKPAAYPTYASQVFREDGTPLEQGGVLQGMNPLDVYPVGSIYISASDASPAGLFGGTWEQLEDRFLVGAGSKYAAGSAGEGNLTEVIGVLGCKEGVQHNSSSYTARVLGVIGSYKNDIETIKSLSQYDGFSGDPPYLAVYMWKRVS